MYDDNLDDFDRALSAADEAHEVDPAEAKPAEDNEDLLTALAHERMLEIREELVESMPALEPFADLLSGDDESSIRKLAHELNSRLGGEVRDDHPGAADSEDRRIAALDGATAYDKAKSLAREGDTAAFFALKTAAALEAEGISGRTMAEGDRASVKRAAEFARRAGDHAAYQRLLSQLG
jgi:hypothetical protein